MTNSRKQCTEGQKCQPANEQEALYCDLHHSKLPLARIAEVLDVRPGYLMDAANPDRDDTQFQSRKLSRLSKAIGGSRYLEAICLNAGGVFVAIPEAVADNEEMSLHTVKVLREVADVIQSTAKALAGDQRIDEDECRDMEREIDEAVSVLVAMKTRARQMVAKKPLRAVEGGR